MIVYRLAHPIFVDQRRVDRIELRPGVLPLEPTPSPLHAAVREVDAVTVRNALAARTGLPAAVVESLAAFDLAVLLHIAASDTSRLARPPLSLSEAPAAAKKKRA